MSSATPRIVYQPRSDATPEGELNALAASYDFILKIARKKAAAADAGEKPHEEGSEHVSRNRTIPQP